MKPSLLISLILIVSLSALILSIYNTYSLVIIDKKIAEIDKSVERINPMIEKFEPLMPDLEVLKPLLPKLQQLLLSIPPAS
ncbi:MAG: hypothetical protein PHI53_01170 [Candidatus Pacebacteria bacterium]|nr:hypothetical protein [Candidatus Paceibacterota bacterium]